MQKIKVTLLAVAILFGVQAKAQLIPISIGIKGGVNTSDFSGGLNTSNRAGFNAGLTARLNLPANFYVGANAEITQKGAKLKHFKSIEGSDVESKANPLFLQIPVHLGYKYNLGLSARLRVEAGPYWAYGIGGKIKGDGKKFDFFGDNTFKKNDFGFGVAVGFDFWKLGVDLGYDFGLTNLSHIEGTKARTRNGYLSFSYRFL